MSNILLPKPALGTPIAKGQLLSKGLVGNFLFNEGRGDILGNSSLEKGNDGTITDAEWQGQYLFMDGTGTSHVKISKPVITGYPFSVVMFGEVTATSGGDFYWSSADEGTSAQNIGMRVLDGKLEGWIFTTTFNATTGDTSLAVGDKIMGAWVCASDTDRKLYLNGRIELVDATDSDAFPTSIDNVCWGALIRSTTAYNPCKVSSTLLYNRALSASEIAALYLNPALPMQQPPIWLFTPPVVVGLTIPIAMHHYKQMQGAA